MDMTRAINNGYFALRWRILLRDNYTCQYCGQHAPNVKLEIDHIIPTIDGGEDEPDNLITACYACNRGKEGLRIISKSKTKRTFVPTSPKHPTQDKTIEYMTGRGEVKAKDIAKYLNITGDYSFILLERLIQKNLVTKVKRGVYSLVITG